MYLLVALAILVAVTSFISTQSTTKLANILWDLYLKFSSNEVVQQVRSKRERLAQVKQERSATSSKDEFAKWAKLDREHRKLKTEIDGGNQTLAQKRQSIQQATRALRWAATSGVKLYVQWRYRKVPVIYLPHNVFPSYIEYFLSLPSAPKGTVSVATWITITSTVYSATLKQAKTAKTRVQSAMKKANTASPSKQ